jgi:hypothetical protein
MPIDLGVAGDSAAREHQKRRANRERRIEARWGRMAPLVVRLDRWTGEPQSQRAWARGAHGEAKVAAELAKHLGDPVTLLHDRRVPGSKANIDHIAVGPGGVTVIDSKNLTGDVRIERWGGLFTERSSHLVVNGRKRRGLVTGVQKQVGLVAGCLRDAGLTVDVRGVLCMANTDALPLKAAFKRLEIDGVRVSGPRRTAELAARPGDPPIDVDAVARLLAERFPRA